MKKNRAISLLLAIVMILALMPTAFAVYSYHMDVTVEEPVVGAKPAATAVSRNNKDTNNPKAIPVSEPPRSSGRGSWTPTAASRRGWRTPSPSPSAWATPAGPRARTSSRPRAP